MFNEKYLVNYALSSSSDTQNFYYHMEINGTKYGVSFQKIGSKKSYEMKFGMYSPTGQIKIFKIKKSDLYFLLKTASAIYKEFIEENEGVQVIVIRFPKQIDEKYVKLTEKIIKKLKLVQYENMNVNKNPDSALEENFLFYKRKSVSLELALKSLNIKKITTNYQLPSVWDDMLSDLSPNKKLKNKIDIDDIEYLGKKHIFDSEDLHGKEKTKAQKFLSKNVFVDYKPEKILNNEIIEIVSEVDEDKKEEKTQLVNENLRTFLVDKSSKFKIINLMIDLMSNSDIKQPMLTFSHIAKFREKSKKKFSNEILSELLFKHNFLEEDDSEIFEKLKKDKKFDLNNEVFNMIYGNMPENMDFFSRYYDEYVKADRKFKTEEDFMVYMMLIEVFHATILSKGGINYLEDEPERLKMHILEILNKAINFTHTTNEYKFKVKGTNVFLFSGNYEFKVLYKIIDAVKEIPNEEFSMSKCPLVVFEASKNYTIESTLALDYYAKLSNKDEEVLSYVKMKIKIEQPVNDPHSYQDDFAKSIRKEWKNNMPGSLDDISEWVSYTGGSYTSINKMFREGMKNSGSHFEAHDMLKKYEKFSYALPQTIEVSRKTNYPPNFKLGKIYVDPAPLSTSLSSGVWSGDNKLLITIPKGTKVIPILNDSNHPSEKEIILSPGSMIYPYKIIKSGYSKFIKCVYIGDIRENLMQLLKENAEFRFSFKQFVENNMNQEYGDKNVEDDEELYAQSEDIVNKIKLGEIKANLNI